MLLKAKNDCILQQKEQEKKTFYKDQLFHHKDAKDHVQGTNINKMPAASL